MAHRMVNKCHANRNHSRAKASRRSARAQAWRFQYPSAASSSTDSTRPPLRLLRLRGSAVKESLEHPAPGSLAVVVAEHVLVHVGLKVPRGHPVIDPLIPRRSSDQNPSIVFV